MENLENIRILLDVEERTRGHGTAFAEIRNFALDQLRVINADYGKANAEKLAEKKKAEDEATHQAAVKQAEAAKVNEETVREAPKPAPAPTMITPRSYPATPPADPDYVPPVYPEGSGPIETDTVQRRL